MKPELKQKIKKLLSALAAVFGVLFFLFLKSHRNQTETAGKDALSAAGKAAEKAAEKAKIQKESEIEKADSNDLLASSAHAERNDAKLEELKNGHKERVRNRIRQELQR